MAIQTTQTAVRPPPIARASTHCVLPQPPTDDEKYSYVHRDLPLLVWTSLLSVAMIVVSQLHFISINHWLLVLLPFLLFTIVYFVISMRVYATSRNFDLVAHRTLVDGWSPDHHPSVDILLPICNESLAVLHNTWTYVDRLARRYAGTVHVYVLDDGDDTEAAGMAEEFGFHYEVRPNRGWFKKAGNLRHGYHLSSGEFLVIFDADFAPRDDFLDELLPYMAADPGLGVVQSPQYFHVDKRQTWMERGAGAVQELFYRAVQVSRDQLDGAICVGSCAIYRRAALDTIGGTALIEHSEDVHTGFDLARARWRLRYVPLPLATGLCPDDPDSFLIQQYRWCAGSMSLFGSAKFWRTKMRLSTRLCYISGFSYYLHTAVFTLIAPLIPIVLILGLPEKVHVRNYLWIIPSMLYTLVIFPLWNRVHYGPEALMAKGLSGWAHAFAVWDILHKQRMGWQPTGGGGTRETKRIWTAMTWWGGITSVVWVGGAAIRMIQFNPVNFVLILCAGLLYAGVVVMALMARRVPSRRLAEAKALRAATLVD